MINQLSFNALTCYAPGDHCLTDMRPVNLIFGPNGSGKTSITHALESGECQITWRGNQPRDILIYNSAYERRIINDSPTIKGIFTLGEADAELQDQVEKQRALIEDLEVQIGTIASLVDPTMGRAPLLENIRTLEKNFSDASWRAKKELEPDFEPIFKGYRGSAKKFSAKVLSESTNSDSPTHDLPALRSRVRSAFSENTSIVALPNEPVVDVLRNHGISPDLLAPIVGSESINLSPLLEALNSHDWVHQGLGFLSQGTELCPFCQQDLPDDLERSLRTIFDDAYSDRIQRYTTAQSVVSGALTDLQAAVECWSKLSNKDTEADYYKLLTDLNKHTATIQTELTTKSAQPALSLKISTSPELADRVSDLVSRTRQDILNHNEMVNNIGAERELLREQAWTYIAKVHLSDEVDALQRKLPGAQAIVSKKRADLGKAQQDLDEAKQDLVRLEKKGSTIAPTVHKMNSTLSAFGFTNFTIDQHEDGLNYVLVRSDGTLAHRTLSEGERTLIAFLYFANQVLSTNDLDSVSTRRVVVLDDPVSSLDTEVLYLVSTIVRSLCENIWRGTGTTDQLILLTHSIHFFKEVEFLSKGRRRPNQPRRPRAYWLVRKGENGSSLERHQSNPISTTYELLWAQVRREDPDSVSLQNSMRRILESYFKLLGGIDNHQLVSKLSGAHQVAARALFSWANEGSHSAFDEPAFPRSEHTANIFKDVFKLIFVEVGHEAHYLMMMRENEGSPGN